jgi:hypothetical protein
MAGPNAEDFTEEERANLREIARSSEKFLGLSVFERRQFVADWVCAFPERHNQNRWFTSGKADLNEIRTQSIEANECGTAACVAGWTVLFADKLDTLCYSGIEGDFEPLDISSIPENAAGLLGLNISQASWLFDYINSRDKIRTIVADINNGVL